MHPSSLLSYYPNYSILDEVLAHGFQELNLYIDLKNNLQTLYLEHAIKNVVESTLKSNTMDTSIFSSLMSFLSFHKIYALKRNIKIKFFIFFESGTSFYHTNINKSYKLSRKSDDLYGLDREKRDLFYTILQNNYSLIESAYNKLPNITVIRVPNLEADFVPYYLIRNSVVETKNIAHIIYSNDHDLLQTIELGNNVFVFRKNVKSKKIIKAGQVIKSYLKIEQNYPDNWLPLIMSIIGDTGDDITGFKGIGAKRMTLFIEELVNTIGGIDKLYDNVFNNLPVFGTDIPPDNQNKYVKTIANEENTNNRLSKNLKLISFELISRFLDNPTNTEFIAKRNKIISVANSNSDHAPKEIIQNAIKMTNIYIQPEELDILYL